MAELGNWLAVSIGAIIVSVMTQFFKNFIDHGKRWKNKTEQFDDLIVKTGKFMQESAQEIDRAHLENSIFAKFGWAMPVEAVAFLIQKESFPSNIDKFHKSRRSMSFKDGAFYSVQSKLSRAIASPTDKYIRAYERLGMTLTFGWSGASALLLLANKGFNYATPILTGMWAITTPLILFVVYLLGATLADMRRDRALLQLNHS